MEKNGRKRKASHARLVTGAVKTVPIETCLAFNFSINELCAFQHYHPVKVHILRLLGDKCHTGHVGRLRILPTSFSPRLGPINGRYDNELLMPRWSSVVRGAGFKYHWEDTCSWLASEWFDSTFWAIWIIFWQLGWTRVLNRLSDVVYCGGTWSWLTVKGGQNGWNRYVCLE